MKITWKLVLPLILTFIFFYQLKSQVYLDLYMKQRLLSDVPIVYSFWFYVSPYFIGLLLIITIVVIYISPAWSTITFLIIPVILALPLKFHLFPAWVHDYNVQYVLKILVSSSIFVLIITKIKKMISPKKL
jgi:hypothetical protein